MKVKWFLLFIITSLPIFFCNSCEKNESVSLEELIKSTTWTQKTGFLNGEDIGQIKRFHQMTFFENGFCHIVWDPWQGGYPPPSELDTLDTKYYIENNQLIFPESFGEIIIELNGTIDTLKTYVMSYEIISFEEKLIHMDGRFEPDDSSSMYLGPREMYLEPY
ncbi:MAG: hypothetical protein IH598_12410 [Bacteroidales bacterium]|nr:hypothetical protein [Bacteroidales bacterium]